jgi:predicted Zn-ribbon and HTH transcriptional regulator
MSEITLKGYRCERCSHEWVPREQEIPTVCPKCKSPYLNKPRKDEITKPVDKLENARRIAKKYAKH